MRWMLNNVILLVEFTPGHNIVVEILIPTMRFLVLHFHTNEGLCELLNFSESIIFNEHIFAKN